MRAEQAPSRYGGVFRVTEGPLKAFGEERVLDTPLAESGIVGCAIGLALYGLKPVCEFQFLGFSYLAMQQFESHAARLRWRSRGRYTVPLVARMPYGGDVRLSTTARWKRPSSWPWRMACRPRSSIS